MTRTFVLITTVAALALVSAFATSAVAGDKRMRIQHYNDELITGTKGSPDTKIKMPKIQLQVLPGDVQHHDQSMNSLRRQRPRR